MRLILMVLVPGLLYGAQRSEVLIIGRQATTNNYTRTVPGTQKTSTDVHVNCLPTPVRLASNCSATSTTQTTGSPAQKYDYSVTAMVLALLLEDGRVALVGCSIRSRSCRTPISDNIQAEFNGKKAKLLWPTSIDGKKSTTEDYTVMEVMSRQEYQTRVSLQNGVPAQPTPVVDPFSVTTAAGSFFAACAASEVNKSLCQGYVFGLLEGMMILTAVGKQTGTSAEVVCLSRTVGRDEVLSRVRDWASGSPEMNAREAVLRALASNYPCQAPNKP